MESKTIKFAEGFKIDFDGNIKEFRQNGKKAVGQRWNDGMDYLRIPKDKNLRDDLFRKFFAFGVLDLTEAYQGHRCVVSWIPVGE